MTKFKTHGLAMAVAVLALVLNGCGGSSSTMDDEPLMPDPAALASANAALTSAGDAASAAQTAYDAADAALDGAIDALEGAVTALEAASGEGTAQAIADHTAAKSAQAVAQTAFDAAMSDMQDAIAAYDAAHMALAALEPTATEYQLALVRAETRLDALKRAQMAASRMAGGYTDRVMAAQDAAGAALDTLDGPDMAQKALAAAGMALDGAESAADSAKMALDTANTELDSAIVGLTALDGNAAPAAVAAATAAYQQAVAGQAAAQTASDGAMAALTSATQAYEVAYEALKAVDPTATDLMEARMRIAGLEQAAQDAAEKAKADLAALQMKIDDANKQLAALQMQIDEAQKAADAARVAAKAAGTTMALGDYTMMSPTADTIAQRMEPRLEATSATTGTELMVTHSGAAVKVTAAKFKTDAPMSVGTGWNGQMLVKKVANISSTSGESVPGTVSAMVYTDIEAPKQRALSSNQWTQGTFNMAFMGAAFGTATDPLPAANVSDGKLTIPLEGRGENRAWPGKAMGMKIPMKSNTTSTIEDSFTGTLNGVSGTFRCSTTSCTIKKVGTDAYEVSDNLTFVAAVSQTVSVVDSEYMTLGYWLTEPDEGTGAAHHYSVGAFAAPVTAVNVEGAMTGKATYKGPAVGVYAEKQHSGKSARSGMFTAEAMLNAHFGDSSASGLINGTVSNFMEDGKSLGKWSVHLGGDQTDTDGDGGGTSVTTGGSVLSGDKTTFASLTDSEANVPNTANSDTARNATTSGTFDGLSGRGVWQAEFSGAGTVANDAPNNITGTFDVTVGANVLNVSGAFGATKQ